MVNALQTPVRNGTHRVNEHELLHRLECPCQTLGVEFPKEAWPKDDHKAYFPLGVCATEDMKDLSLRERLERLDDWARQRNLLKPNETLFAKKQVKAQQPTFPAKNPHVRRPFAGSISPPRKTFPSKVMDVVRSIPCVIRSFHPLSS
jgi:hypothetical protein